MTTIGYARVSTRDQSLEIQIEQLKAAGCEKIFHEKQSGAKSDNRPQLARLLKAVGPGDVVVITRLDRLARSSRDLLNIIHDLNEAGAAFRSLADPWCDTTTPHGKLILTVLGGLAEFERTLIMSRTEAGIQRAREMGKTFGRPVRLNAKQKRIIADRYGRGETITALAADFEVGVATIHRALKAA
jgi:DNA invertase Pin-like site-specific DNA recombinase